MDSAVVRRALPLTRACVCVVVSVGGLRFPTLRAPLCAECRMPFCGKRPCRPLPLCVVTTCSHTHDFACGSLTGFTAPLFYGRGIFQYGWGILPHRRPLTTVVGTWKLACFGGWGRSPLSLSHSHTTFACLVGPGSAITLPKIEKPTKEDVDKYHKLYVEALRKLYESHRKEFEHPVDRNGNPIQTKGFRIVG